nr:MAG TPA: hypothetical protein [Caudoviricetes sp.]
MADLGNLENLDDERNANVAVTSYEDFRKIVYAFIKRMNPGLNLKTDKDVDSYVKNDSFGGEGMIGSIYNERKKEFKEGRYVYDSAACAAMNVD